MANKLVNVNLVAMDKSLKDRVKTYGDTLLWGDALRKQYAVKVSNLDNTVRQYYALRNSESSFLFDPEKYAQLVAETMKGKESLRAELTKALGEEAPWAWDANDEALYKAYRAFMTKNKGDLDAAVAAWFTPYNTEHAKATVNSTLVDALVTTILRKEDYTKGNKILTGKANGKDWDFMTTLRTKDNFLKTFYSKLAQMLYEKNALVLRDIPQDVLALYVRKSSKKAETAKQ